MKRPPDFEPWTTSSHWQHHNVPHDSSVKRPKRRTRPAVYTNSSCTSDMSFPTEISDVKQYRCGKVESYTDFTFSGNYITSLTKRSNDTYNMQIFPGWHDTLLAERVINKSEHCVQFIVWMSWKGDRRHANCTTGDLQSRPVVQTKIKSTDQRNEIKHSTIRSIAWPNGKALPSRRLQTHVAKSVRVSFVNFVSLQCHSPWNKGFPKPRITWSPFGSSQSLDLLAPRGINVKSSDLGRDAVWHKKITASVKSLSWQEISGSPCWHN